MIKNDFLDVIDVNGNRVIVIKQSVQALISRNNPDRTEIILPGLPGEAGRIMVNSNIQRLFESLITK